MKIIEYSNENIFSETIKPKKGDIIPLNNIYFQSGKAKLLEESDESLKKLNAFLEKNPQLEIRINGHTDSKGNSILNKLLSEKRAKTIYSYLIENGIGSERLYWEGFGEEQPITNNSTKEGRKQNRRVEIEIIEINRSEK